MIRISRLRFFAPLVRSAVAALVIASPAAAQDTGVVSGTVVDSSGQVVPGATVTLTNENTRDLRTLTSNERGDFSFRAVTPGSYTVKVELTGFRSIERRNNIVNASSQLDGGKLLLGVGALSEVAGGAAARQWVGAEDSD